MTTCIVSPLNIVFPILTACHDKKQINFDFIHKHSKSATGHLEQRDVNMAFKSVLSLFLVVKISTLGF